MTLKTVKQVPYVIEVNYVTDTSRRNKVRI